MCFYYEFTAFVWHNTLKILLVCLHSCDKNRRVRQGQRLNFKQRSLFPVRQIIRNSYVCNKASEPLDGSIATCKQHTVISFLFVFILGNDSEHHVGSKTFNHNFSVKDFPK